MNIKGLIPNIQASEVRSVDRTGRAIQSDSAHDRDANGQEAYQQQNQQEQKPPMTEEQLENAMEHLRKLPAFKEHRWTVSLEEEDGKRCVLVKDNLGALIRRIPELELWTLPTDDSPRGQLLKRSA